MYGVHVVAGSSVDGGIGGGTGLRLVPEGAGWSLGGEICGRMPSLCYVQFSRPYKTIEGPQKDFTNREAIAILRFPS